MHKMIGVLCAVAVAASPFFEKFPRATLPLTLDAERLGRGAKLDLDEAAANLQLTAKKVGLGALYAEYHSHAGGDEPYQLELWAGVALPWPGLTWLVVHAYQEQPMAAGSSAWLVGLGPGGRVVNQVLLGEWLDSEAGGAKDEVSLAAAASFGRKHVVTPVLHDLPEGRELKIVATTWGKVRPNGVLQRGPLAYESNQGAFIDEKSKEELAIVHTGAGALEVYYQGSVKKEKQLLAVDGDAGALQFDVRFKAGGKPYRLSFDEARAVVKCRNPDGTTQTFTRQAWAR